MEVKKTVTYQHVQITEVESIAWLRKCVREGNQITEIEGWRNHNGLIIISLGHEQWLVPVLDHTGEERYD